MSDNKGGPAFPQNTQVVANGGQVLHQGFMGGMTLRDYFAAKAMQAYCSQYDYSEERPEVTAEYSYRIADAMLKAREQ